MMDFITQHAGVIGLALFFSFFVAATFLAFRPSKKATLEAYAHIPLQETHHD